MSTFHTARQIQKGSPNKQQKKKIEVKNGPLSLSSAARTQAYKASGVPK